MRRFQGLLQVAILIHAQANEARLESTGCDEPTCDEYIVIHNVHH